METLAKHFGLAVKP